MLGDKLHCFDLELCQYVLANIRGNADRPDFASYIARQLDAPILAYFKALAGEGEPPSLLLTDTDFCDLAETFEGGPHRFDRYWVAHEPLHRRGIHCVPEIRAALAQECAEEWVRTSARLAEQLESDRLRLSGGIRVVHDWVREARRLLRAMGATALLPAPEGAFPSLACPEPPPPARPGEDTLAELTPEGGERPVDSVARIEALQLEIRDLLLHQRTVKDWYSTDEIAQLLGKDPFTVREWCRRGRVRAEKKGSGRGKHQFWVISHEELQRIQREGLLPASSG